MCHWLLPTWRQVMLSLRTGARGVSRAEVTACAAGANSIGSAFREIKHGYADAIIAGGAEAAICELGIAGFRQP